MSQGTVCATTTCGCDHHPVTEKSDDAVRRFRLAAASDLSLLADLHDRELDEAQIAGLREVDVGDWFALRAASAATVEAQICLAQALRRLPQTLDATVVDALAADYANAFLLNAYRAPPTESPWLDKDQLERQEPMFEIAAWYRRYGLAAQDRQRRSEDHFVLQLRFLSHLLAGDACAQPDAEAARFMDAHLLKWFPRFATKIVDRCETVFYGALMAVTLGRVIDLREQLVALTGIERPAAGHEPVIAVQRTDDAEVRPFIPGAAPGW